jgi:hypothetical protein
MVVFRYYLNKKEGSMLRKKQHTFLTSTGSIVCLIMCGVVLASFSFMSCTGACVGTGGIVDECKEGWDKSECTEWDELGVNDADWNFHSGKSCEDQGYTVECPDGSFVKSAGDC